MSDTYTHTAEMVYGQPWALRPPKLGEIAEAFDRRVDESAARTEREAARGEKPARVPYVVHDNLAIVRVFGSIVKRANLFTEFSGGTSTELLRTDMQAALEDPMVDGLLLEVDSPGGSVFGAFELADYVFAARGKKPIIALANECMCSAAYLISSGADVIMATEAAVCGSIGVIYVLREYAEAETRAGRKTHLITAGKYKGVGHPAVPLTEEGRGEIQRVADHYYGMFLQRVARHRQMSVESVLAMAEGREYVGREALEVGLIDGISTLTELVGGSWRGIRSRIGRGTTPQGGSMTVEELRQKFGAQVSEIEKAAVASASAKAQAETEEVAKRVRAEAVAAERARCQQVAAAFADAPTFGADAIGHGWTLEQAKAARYDAVAAELAAARAFKAEQLSVIQENTAELRLVPPFSPAPEQVAAAVPGTFDAEACRRQFQATAALQREFITEGAYLGFCRAKAKGLITEKKKSG